MLKIEIYAKARAAKFNAGMIQLAINATMREIGLGKEAITIIMGSTAKSCDGKSTPVPSLRICDVDIERIKNVLQAFKSRKLCIRTEILLLYEVISADEMC